MPSAKIIKVDPLNPQGEHLREAADVLIQGGLVIIPTETVYGIAANASNVITIKRLLEIKQRPADKPFSLHISDKQDVEQFVGDIPPAAYKLIDKFWPGPLTLVLKANTGASVGIRLPDNEIARRVIALVAMPVVCPSANISGKPAPTDFSQAINDLSGLVDLAIDAGPTKLQTESSVVDLTGPRLNILREGAIKAQAIEDAVKKKIVLFVCTGNSCRSVMAEALLKQKLKQTNRQDIEVLSAGVLPISGMSATELTEEILKRHAMDISGHRSQAATKEVLKKSDIILVMEKAHEERILELAPQVKNRVFLLREFAKITDNNPNIADPIGRPADFYEQTFNLIQEAINKIIGLI